MQGELLYPGVTEGPGHSISVGRVWSLTDLQEQLFSPLMTWHEDCWVFLQCRAVGLHAMLASFHRMSIFLEMHTTTRGLWHFALHQGLNLDEMLDCPDVCDQLVMVFDTAHWCINLPALTECANPNDNTLKCQCTHAVLLRSRSNVSQ